ncbi:MAG: PLDc N-terminal domain-containing protein [Thermoanaerobaculia bacterium]
MLALVFGQTTGCIGLFVLIADILCIVQVVESSKSTLRKTLWIVLVVCFPMLGALLWLLLGRK